MDKKSSLVDQTECSLLDMLKSAYWKVGDTLPNEKTLAATLQVSRSVIREAMGRLRIRGFIQSRQKRGTIITRPDPVDQMIKELDPEMMDNTTLIELLEMRLALEVGMADFIIKRATLQDQEILKGLISATDKDQNNRPGNDPAPLFDLEEELSFHGKLYDIAGNRSVKKLLMGLIPIVSYILENKLLEDPPVFKKTVTHSDLVGLIATGSAEKLRKGLRQHLNGYYKRLFLEGG